MMWLVYLNSDWKKIVLPSQKRPFFLSSEDISVEGSIREKLEKIQKYDHIEELPNMAHFFQTDYE